MIQVTLADYKVVDEAIDDLHRDMQAGYDYMCENYRGVGSFESYKERHCSYSLRALSDLESLRGRIADALGL